MQNDFYFDILNHLSEVGINIPVDITAIVIKYYPDDGDYDLVPRRLQIMGFLDKMEHNIEYKFIDLFDHNASMQPTGHRIIASLTVIGFNFLANVKRDESTLQTNAIISKQSKWQTRVLIGALAISFMSLVISYISYKESKKPTQLLPSRELIESLKSKQDRPQKKVDSLPSKPSTKKN